MRARRSVESCFPKATSKDSSVFLELTFAVLAFIFNHYENFSLNRIIAEI